MCVCVCVHLLLVIVPLHKHLSNFIFFQGTRQTISLVMIMREQCSKNFTGSSNHIPLGFLAIMFLKVHTYIYSSLLENAQPYLPSIACWVYYMHDTIQIIEISQFPDIGLDLMFILHAFIKALHVLHLYIFSIHTLPLNLSKACASPQHQIINGTYKEFLQNLSQVGSAVVWLSTLMSAHKMSKLYIYIGKSQPLQLILYMNWLFNKITLNVISYP